MEMTRADFAALVEFLAPRPRLAGPSVLVLRKARDMDLWFMRTPEAVSCCFAWTDDEREVVRIALGR